MTSEGGHSEGAHSIHRTNSAQFNHPESANQSNFPYDMHRRMSDDYENRRDKPFAPHSRSATDSQAKDLSAGFVSGRKGGFSGTPSKWGNERENVSRTGRFAYVSPTLEEKWESGLETVPLHQFVMEYSRSLPALISFEEGHYESLDSETFSNQERLIISFVKSRNVLIIETSMKQKFNLPLGSAVQVSLLYNPEGNIERACKGYQFQSIGEIIEKYPEAPHLPRVIRATKAYSGDRLNSSVYANELLVVGSYDTITNRLQVISHGKTSIPKFLPNQCEGEFTTEPSKVRLYVSDIDYYIRTLLNVCPNLLATLDVSELALMSPDTQIDRSLNGVVTLSGFGTERSLIATRVKGEGISSAQPKMAFEIPIDDNFRNIKVRVLEKNMADPPVITSDVQLEPWCQKSTATTKVQRLFDDYVRHGHENDGVINPANNIYDEVSEPSPPKLPPRIAHPSPYAISTLQSQQNLHKDDTSEFDSGTTINDHEDHQERSRLKESAANYTSDHYVHTSGDSAGVTKSELEMTIRSVLSEVMSEQHQRVQPDRYSYYYTSMDSTGDEADSVSKVKLSDVIIELNEIENLWYTFGILLGISKSKLDQIQANYGSGPCPHGRCLIETICQWKDNHENTTWSSIVRALYSMQKKQLAKRVAAKHKIMLPDPREFSQDQFTKHLKEFVPEDTLSEITSRQQQMQKQDQSLSEIQERLGEYEQRMEENHKDLLAIKDHLQFNERFTRMLTRENQVLRMKLAHKEQLFKSPNREAWKSKDGQNSQENLRKEIHTLHEAQKSYESRLTTAHHDTMDLKRQLLSIEAQMEMIKKPLHSLQDQKHKLTRGLHEQECELSHIITGTLNRDDKEDDGLPQYYNIIRCDGKVEVKLHKEELTMLQRDLDRKTNEVGCLKKELQQKHEQMSHVESLLAKQQDDELMYTYTDGTESIILEKHQNDHRKTRLQMEKIDCQIQLTRALLQKKDIESKLEAVKQNLDVSETICQRAQELSRKRMSNRSISFSSTTSEDSDVFVSKGTSARHSSNPVLLSNGKLDTNKSELHVDHNTDPVIKPHTVKKPANSRSTVAAHSNIDREKDKGSRPRTSTLPSAAQRNYRTSSASSGDAHHRRCTTKQSQTHRPSHKTQVAKNE